MDSHFPMLALCLAVVLASVLLAHSAPPTQHPYLLPPAEKARLLARIQGGGQPAQAYAAIKAGADKGNPGDAALVYALEGGDKYASVVRTYLLNLIKYQGPRLDDDVAAGGHREGLMYFYWDTQDVRWYDLVAPALSAEDRQTIEGFYAKLGRYWKASFTRWTTTPNLTFPIHYHAAVIGFCINDPELIEWGLRDEGSQFGPTHGGLYPTLDAMLRDGAVWDEATIYAAVNVLVPMVQLSILYKLYYGKDLYAWTTPKGSSIKKLVDSYLALGYPLEHTGVGLGTFRVATYGDGSTESPHIGHHGTDCLYLVNRPWLGESRFVIDDILEQAYYASRDPQYAWFLSFSPDRTPSFLYGEAIPAGSVKAPPAPCSLYPEAGIAMLRADESPAYWTGDGLAVLQVMGRGYGHDHRDKLSITMHAGGRLMYPDMNCVQYESNNVNWTRNTIAHNTLIVDKGDTANSDSTCRHDFAPEVKFLATTAHPYDGVTETRALALTREYLLDLFWADSAVPHTYDWVVHALGKLQWEHPALYQPSSDLLRDYWWVEDETSRRTGLTWRADFIQQNGLAVPGMGKQTKEWFNDHEAVRVTMAGEPGTTVYGGIGPSGGPPADSVMNPEGNLPLLLARRQGRTALFTVVHEPYKNTPPAITGVRKIAAIPGASVTEVRAANFIDRVAVAFGEQADNKDYILQNSDDPGEVFAFRDYAYLRWDNPAAGGKPVLTARGNWVGFRLRCPGLPAQGALTVNGKRVTYRREGDYLLYGKDNDQPAPRLVMAGIETLPDWVTPGRQLALTWNLRNTGKVPLSNVEARLLATPGLVVDAVSVKAESIPAGGEWTARIPFTVAALSAGGADSLTAVIEVAYTDEKGRHTVTGSSQETMLAPVLEVTVPTEPVRLAATGTRETVLHITNWSDQPREGRIQLRLPAGITVDPLPTVSVAQTPPDREGETLVTWAFPRVMPGETREVKYRLLTAGKAPAGLHTEPVTLAWTGSSGEEQSAPATLRLTVGTVMLDDNTFPAFGEYLVYAPTYTFRISKLYGTSRFLRDDAGRPRFEDTFWDRRTAAPHGGVSPNALPMLRIDGEPVMAWGKPAQFMWPTRSPAGVTIGTDKGRLRWDFKEDRIRIAPVPLWTSEKPHEFVFPNAWTAWNGSPEWMKIIVVDANGQEQVLAKAPPQEQEVRFIAAMLRVPGYDEAVCFTVDKPQPAHFNGPELHFTVNQGEALAFGLCKPEAFDAWRKKE